MKRTCILGILTLCSSFGFCVEENEQFVESVEKNPGIRLNPQDLPIFFKKDSPLNGLHTFNLIPPLSPKDPEVQKKIQRAIEKELEQIGEVVRLKETDTRGMGAGNILNIQIGSVLEWDNKELPISRVSLQVQTSAVIKKTGIKTFPVVWSINSFSQNSSRPDSENATLKATQKLVEEFIQNYKYANPGQKEKPKFYTYY